MDLDRLRAQLKADEGYKLKVYKDTKGLLTVGVGHLVTPADMLHLGDEITQARCDELFKYDLGRTLVSCEREIDGWSQFPDEVQEILANMAYNLGVVGLLKFRITLSMLRQKDYQKAADALVGSRWYSQVGNRSKRLVARLRALVCNSPAHS